MISRSLHSLQSLHSLRCRVVPALTVLAMGCSGSGTSAPAAVTAHPSIDESSAGTRPPDTAPASSAQITTTSIPSDVVAIASDLGGVIGLALGSGNLPPADAACLGPRLDELGPSGLAAVEGMQADPINRLGVDPDAAEAVFLAFLSCLGQPALLSSLSLAVLRPPPAALPCVNEQWTGLVDADAIVSSLAHGHGLDDLEPGLADELAEAAEPCLGDDEWWIEEISLRLSDLDAVQADCVAARYVDVLGARAVIRQRILTLPLSTVTADDAAALDLSSRCGVPDADAPRTLGANLGDCLTGFGQGTAATTISSCEDDHNAEVIEVDDLTDDVPSWPGAQELRHAAERQCVAAAEAIPGDTSDWAAGWDLPGRQTWERGGRTLTCVLIKPEYASWRGPSGLSPASVDATTPSPTAALTGTTLPSGAREMFSLDEVDRVGMCIYRAPVLPGQDDLQRRFFDVGCDQPHQVELIERFDVDGPPRAPYPSEQQVRDDANNRCTRAFATYVGTPYEASRLRYTYFYPSAASWADGDRTVICLLIGEQVDELFDRAMAGSAE